MKQLLITGFEPFGAESVNPSWEAVKRLPDRIGDYILTKIEIPTIFGTAAEKVLVAAEELGADTVLCIGQAGGRDTVTPEVIAINLRDAEIPDNAGSQPVGVPIVREGPAAYFSTVPVREIVKKLQTESVPSSLSYSAGAFVCNDVFFSLLHHFNGSQTQVGFIHVPFLPEQAKDGQPSMDQGQIIRALTLAVKAI